MRFRHPEPTPVSGAIWPVFLPFAGCPYRCIYCAQDKQTGVDGMNLEAIRDRLELDLADALSSGRGPYELAFYGGTFTALPSPWPETFLNLTHRFRERGLITRIRCSTRPDCVSVDALIRLRTLGLDMVELGIQSFDNEILTTSGRGYTGDIATAACGMVKDSGLSLGIQLLPGLPGDRPGVFASDVRRAAELEPEVVRIYPCLVIWDTPLATLWKRGGFKPWSLDHTKGELAEALLVLWSKGVRVIRLGLPPEGTLSEHILDGPWHPALGQSVRGLALFKYIQSQVRKTDMAPARLDVPRRYQGELLGHANELVEDYARLGLSKRSFRYVASDEFVLE